MIMAANALPYARHAIETLAVNCLEDFTLSVVTDDATDKTEIEQAVREIEFGAGKFVNVVAKDEIDAIAEKRFAAYPAFLKFRNGHPCWRKITDPLVLSESDEEAIILDPDLYFPNKFTFEPTLDDGIALMYQKPNCLLPPEAVERVFDLSIPLADHVDIGVAQLRAGTVDMAWLEQFLDKLDAEEFARFMHIEAIVWSAILMKAGGGYFDPGSWRCWQRGQVKRFAIAAGVPGTALLRLEPLEDIKCIHVSGPSKWWVVDAIKAGALKTFENVYDQPSPLKPQLEYTRAHFNSDVKLKSTLRRLGYYKLTKSE